MPLPAPESPGGKQRHEELKTPCLRSLMYPPKRWYCKDLYTNIRNESMCLLGLMLCGSQHGAIPQLHNANRKRTAFLHSHFSTENVSGSFPASALPPLSGCNRRAWARKACCSCRCSTEISCSRPKSSKAPSCNKIPKPGMF